MILGIVGFSSFIAIFSTAVQLFLDYRRDLDRVQSEFAYVQVVSLQPLSTNLWNMAEENVQQQLDSLANHPGIDYAAIRVKDRIAWTSGTEPKGAAVMAEYPLVHERANFKRELGRLQIVAGLSAIYQQLVEKALVILGTNFLKTLTVAAFMYVLFHIFFTRHLVALSDYARNMNLKDLAKPLRFQRKRIEGERSDEFDDIAQAMNQMRTNLKESYDELVESEENFRRLTEDSAQGYFIHEDLRPVFVNSALADMFGFDGPDEVLRIPSVLDLFAPRERERLSGFYEARRKGEAAPGHFEVEGVRKDGTPVSLSLSAQLVTWQGRRLIGLTVVDITERKRAEEALRVTEEQLRQAQRLEALGWLAGGIAHDFNNILLPIITITEVCRDDLPPDSELSGHLGKVLLAAQRGRALVDQITKFSRRQPMERRSADLWEAIEEALKLARTTVPSMIEIRSHFDAAVGKVLADSNQIHEVVVNLITNATHAIGAEMGIIEVTLHEVRISGSADGVPVELEPGTYACLTISDTGAGMEEETLAHIFDPFFTTKPFGEGTGMGLAVVHGIVTGHDGAIAVSSQPRIGTTFEIYLPVIEMAATAPSDVESTGVRLRGKFNAGRGTLPDADPHSIVLGDGCVRTRSTFFEDIA